MLLRNARNSLLAFLTCAAAASGQSITTATVTGIVEDPSGAVIPQATVALTNTNTNAVQKTATNGSGAYQFGFTAPGIYALEVAAKGFQTEQRTGLVVGAGRPVVV